MATAATQLAERVLARPSPEALVARAEALLPVLRERSAGCEADRKVNPATIQDFREAGFFEILKPAAYGGYEYEPQVMFQVVTKIASACTASAWVGALLMIHNWEIGQAEPKLAEDIWGENPDALISSSYAPYGKAEVVDGGFIANGRWPWSSGSDHGDWVVLGFFFPEAPSPENPFGFRQRALFLPRKDYEIDQSSWNMAGMSGTGSKDIVVENVFVPWHRHHDLTNAHFDRQAGAEVFPAQTYKYPFAMVFAYTLASVILGSAEGALRVFADTMAGRRTQLGEPMTTMPVQQLRMGEVLAKVNAARAVLERDFAEAKGFLDKGQRIPLPNRMNYKWNAAWVGRTSADAIEQMIRGAGGSAFALSHPLQRFFRDTQTAMNHAFIGYEAGASNAGHTYFTGQVRDFLT